MGRIPGGCLQQTRSTAPLTPEVILLLTPKPPRTTTMKRGHMLGILQFRVCEMGLMEAVAKLITERDIDCIEHLNKVTCQEFEDGTGFKLRFNFDINTNE